MTQFAKDVVRGTLVAFSTQFKDQNGVLITPPSATLTIAYRTGGVANMASIAMSNDASGNWAAVWPSANVDPGVVDWCISCGGAIPVAVDGQIRIWINKATP